MSKIALSGNPLGSGTFTIASPDSNNSRTMNLPDSAGDLVVTEATQTLTNKTFSGTQVFGTASLAQPTGSAPLYMCRAWVNFNGTTTPPTIRASGNVSSVTRNGTGDYTVNFTTAMPDANYAAVFGAGYSVNSDNSLKWAEGTTYSTTAIRVFNVGTSYGNSTQNSVTIFR